MTFLAHIRIENAEKIGQSVEDHLIGVSKIASRNAAKIGLGRSGALLGLLHDLGKYSNVFQDYIKSATGLLDQDADNYVDSKGLKGKIDHSTAGAQYIWNKAKDKEITFQIAAQLLSLCITSHHSGLIDCLSIEGENSYLKRINKDYNYTRYLEVIEKVDTSILHKINQILDGNDWIKEIVGFIQKILKGNNSEIVLKFNSGLLLRMLYSCLIDADRQDTANFENPRFSFLRQEGNYIHWSNLVNRLEGFYDVLERECNKEKINEIRKSVSNACLKRSQDDSGIFTLTVPTGGGKTLSSLRFALNHAQKHNLDRIVYVIPFTTIIDQNAQTVRNILEVDPSDKGKIVLEHHSNLLPEMVNWKHKTLTENWDAPIVFTTNVQFLDTFFARGTRSVRRMHQLANSVIIFDEIQALPIKTVHLFSNAINFLTQYCNSSVVLCTATQPLLNKVDKEKGSLCFDSSNEIIPDVAQLFTALKRVDVLNAIRPHGWSPEDIVALAKSQVKETRSCLIVVNTKKNAAIIYDVCRNSTEYLIIHLSTSMCPAHRMEKLKELKINLDNKVHLICVSTQLIEAGVDIDFGSVIRFVAGFDSIAQSAGRCNRNGRNKIGKVFIVNPKHENIESLNEIKIGKKITERVLREIEDSKSGLPNEYIHPDNFHRYFKYFFFNRAKEMSYPVDVGREDDLINLLSVNNKSTGEYHRINGKAPEMYFRQSFMAAADKFKSIDTITQGIVIPYKEEGKIVIADMFSQFGSKEKYSLLKQAQRYTVNIFPNVIKKLVELKALREIPEFGILALSDERYYHPEFGLSTEIVKNYDLLNS